VGVTGVERIRDFVNTLDVESGDDALASPAAVRDWLRAHGLGDPARVTRDDVTRTAALREALRAHLAVNGGGPLDPGAATVMSKQAGRSRVELRLEHGRAALAPQARGVDGALGVLLADVATAMGDGTWSSLKVCAADDCRWAFVDRSRNGSRHWCSMQVCGNRQKARVFRARRR
jgi:predicted RNA-binding Zn ribbon-like protein